MERLGDGTWVSSGASGTTYLYDRALDAALRAHTAIQELGSLIAILGAQLHNPYHGGPPIMRELEKAIEDTKTPARLAYERLLEIRAG